MSKPFQIPAILDTLRTLSDGSIKLTFSTREMPAEHAAGILEHRRKEGWLLFKDAPFEDADIINLPESIPEFHGEKSPSQRLRNVLYRVWEMKGKPDDFKRWRENEMERIINHYKEKLP